MTTPGFSSRSTSTSFRQFPMRDEAVMSENEPGWSNSAPAKDVPADEAEMKVVETTESKTVAPRKTSRKKA